MKIETLNTFCSDDPTRHSIAKPFSWGDWTYATNGAIAIRVPRMDDIPLASKDFLNVDSTDAFKIQYESWNPIGELAPIEYTPCKNCDGTGHDYTCLECHGTGEVTTESDYNEYENDCESCNGKGTLSADDFKIAFPCSEPTASECYNCAGTGKVVDAKTNVKKIGHAHFQLRYLHLLKDLTNVEIGTNNETGVAGIRFDGGEGIIMPVRL